MKKTIFAIIMLSMSFSMMAEPTFTAKATFKISSPKGADDAVYLYESNAFSAANDGVVEGIQYDVIKSINDVESSSKVVNFYAIASWGDAASVGENTLEGLKLKFQANRKEGDIYTITFSDVMGTPYFLKDNMVKGADEKDSLTAIVAGETYSFTQAVSTTEERFEIVTKTEPEADYTRNAPTVIGNWYTICVPGGVDVADYSAVMDVYTVAGYNAAKGLAVDPLVGAMQPGVPYLFIANATKIAFNYNEEPAASDPQEGANYLTGTFVAMQTADVAYVVANNMLNWAAAGTDVPAYRAYLNYADITDGIFPVIGDNAPAPGRKFIAPKAMPTELDEVAAGMADGTYMINGQVVLVKGGKMFNVLGL